MDTPASGFVSTPVKLFVAFLNANRMIDQVVNATRVQVGQDEKSGAETSNPV